MFLISTRTPLGTATFADKATLFLFVLIGFLLIRWLYRFLFDRKNQLGKTIFSAVEIIFLYMIFLICFRFDRYQEFFQSPLPFLQISDGKLTFLSLLSEGNSILCDHVARLLLLSLLANLLVVMVPSKKHPILRVIGSCLSFVLLLCLNSGLNSLLSTWFPAGTTAIAPLILIGFCLLALLAGCLKLLVGAALFVANPIIGGLYTFFFSHFLGRACSRAIVTTVILLSLTYFLNILIL